MRGTPFAFGVRQDSRQARGEQLAGCLVKHSHPRCPGGPMTELLLIAAIGVGMVAVVLLILGRVDRTR